MVCKDLEKELKLHRERIDDVIRIRFRVNIILVVRTYRPSNKQRVFLSKDYGLIRFKSILDYFHIEIFMLLPLCFFRQLRGVQ